MQGIETVRQVVMKLVMAAAAVSVAMIAAMQAAIADCGRVTMAEMNWAAAELMANVDKLILESGYGFQVVLVPGDTVPTVKSMTESGHPDIAPEIWMNYVQKSIDKAVNAGRLTIAGEILSDGGEEGWWVPKYMVERHPELKTLAAALERPDLFPSPADKSRGAVHNCPVGWGCQIVTSSLFQAFAAKERGFDLIEPGSGADLDQSIDKAHARKTGWLGYYWAPSAIMGRYEMQKLEMGVEHDQGEWQRCTAKSDCADPKPNNWRTAVVMTVTSAKFAKDSPEAFAYLSNRAWPNRVVNKFLVYMDENRVAGDEAAKKFLEEHQELWHQWAPPNVLQKIKAALRANQSLE